MATFDLAEQLKQSLQNASSFDFHSLKKANLEDKINFLKALSLVMAADERIALEEQAFFGAVTRTLVNNDILQGLLAYARDPDLTEVSVMKETMAKNRDFQIALIFDAAILAYVDGEFDKREENLIVQLRELIKWDHGTFAELHGHAKAIATTPEGPALDKLCATVPASLISHILEHRGVKTSPHHVATKNKKTIEDKNDHLTPLATFQFWDIDDLNEIQQKDVTDGFWGI